MLPNDEEMTICFQTLDAGDFKVNLQMVILPIQLQPLSFLVMDVVHSGGTVEVALVGHCHANESFIRTSTKNFIFNGNNETWSSNQLEISVK